MLGARVDTAVAARPPRQLRARLTNMNYLRGGKLLAARLFGSGASFVQPGLADGSVAACQQADVKILTSELHAPVLTR